MSAFIVLSLFPGELRAENEKNAMTAVDAKTSEVTEANTALAELNAETVEANAGMMRLEEIRAMDMNLLTPAEKKDLRKEVHIIQNQQDKRDRDQNRYNNRGRRHHSGGIIFIGGGGLLVLLLLLLLL